MNLKSTVRIFLFAALTIQMMFFITTNIYAENVTIPPDKKYFANVNDLLHNKYNLHPKNNNAESIAKIYFGKNNLQCDNSFSDKQKWYIAGTEAVGDDTGLVLFTDPAQPLETDVAFNSSTNEKTIEPVDEERTRFKVSGGTKECTYEIALDEAT